MIWRGTSTFRALRDRSDAVIRGERTPARRHFRTPDTAGMRREREGVRLPYSPGLDGLRALAVIAVLLYHADLLWIPGGFLGVEVFFVISGYLITALLLAEWRQRGRIDLKDFWLRRARRLLPALYLLLVGTLAYAVLFLPEEVAGLRGDVLAALGYVTNWYLVLGNESYFEAMGRPSLLKHLWSLAVEEQFYLLWPPVLALALCVGATRWRRRRALLLALAGAAISAVLMAVIYRPEVDPSRIYFGTDTRATGLLVGAALAFVWAPWRALIPRSCSLAVRHLRLHRVRQRGPLRRRWGWTVPRLLDAAGLAAIGGLVLLCLTVGEFQPFLYHGGFTVVALATAVVIMACAHPHTHLGARLLGWGPLRWVGQRSYGIYLWHWPVFMVTRPQLDVHMDGPQLLALRLALTVVLADLSYRYVETPVRKGALGAAWRTLREARGFRRKRLSLVWAGAGAPVLALGIALGVAVAQAQPPAPPSYIHTSAIHTTQHAPSGGEAEEPPQEAIEEPSVTALKTARGDEARIASGASGSKHAAAPTHHRERAPFAGPVSAIGDSVMLGSAEQLGRDIPNLAVMDAAVGLQASEAIELLRSRQATGELGEVVVVHIGNNGIFTAEQLDEMMGVLGGSRRVVLVNVNVPRPWALPNNEVLSEGARRYPNAVLVNWYSASVDHPEYFVEDGVHLQVEGQRVYAGLISKRIQTR